jgi:hypothetical protein
MYIYIYMYIYKHIYKHMYMYTGTSSLQDNSFYFMFACWAFNSLSFYI